MRGAEGIILISNFWQIIDTYITMKELRKSVLSISEDFQVELDRGVDFSSIDQTFFLDWSFNTVLGSIENLLVDKLKENKKKKKEEKKNIING